MATTTRRRFTPSQKALIISKLLEEPISIAELAEEHRIHPLVLTRWRNHAVQNLAKLFENDHKKTEKLKSSYEQKIEEMQAEIDKLNLQLDWLKQATISRLSKEDRNEFVNKDETNLPIRTQTALLGLSRSTLYYQMNHSSSRKSKFIDPLSEMRQLPLYLFAGLSADQRKPSRESEVSKLKIQNGWMDVFGGYH
ncbi:transposase [Cohnella cholangitidis]|uniref:Transposase n=1 Tax=Cohnella cholangitidis TaxID=2598458 RepID=A0A7G5C2P1_9BACL|nr:transposase [Cohnella cholangitidis]QMV43475.1 transposase [Cohnella cholangitidis]